MHERRRLDDPDDRAPPRSPSRSRPRDRVVRAVLREPLARRARLEFLFCLIGVLFGQLGLAVIGALLIPGTALTVARAIPIFGLLLVLVVATGLARAAGDAFRRLAARLLGERVASPSPLSARDRTRDLLRARLRDRTSWRAVIYGLLKLPVALLDLYAVFYWAGVIDLTYPFWWRLFRNHAPGVRLSPVPFLTPFGVFRVETFAGTFLVFAVGVAMVLAAPWVTRAVTSLDRWLIRSLLGPGKLAERVRHLETTRTQVVDDSAATLRRIERDLHDGTQAQLTVLAMKLGQAREKLEQDSDVPFDPSGALELIDEAHRHAKEALVELRDIARGIHPPALDVGLDAALATLVARSSVPAALHVDVPSRPARAIETIAYFSTAELLANVAKHSRASHASVLMAVRDGHLRLEVTDDGIGGAQLGIGSGLSGLADRVRAVDGDLRIVSPPGGPTVVSVELPLRA